MWLGKITKQPAEVQNYYVRYVDYLQEGEVIASVTAAVDVPSELTLIGPVVLADNVALEFWLEGGLDGTTYKLEITATTNYGNVKQDEIKVKVKEV